MTVRKQLWANYPDCYLAILFSGRHKLSPDEEGYFYLDNDPVTFNLVIDLLKCAVFPPFSLPPLASSLRPSTA
jgi:hypothetical protein